MDVFIGRSHSFDGDVVLQNNAIEKPVEPVGVTRRHQYTLSIGVNFRVDYGILLEDQRGDKRRIIASNENLYRVILHLAADALNIALCHDISAAQHDDAIRNNVDFMQDMARDDY